MKMYRCQHCDFKIAVNKHKGIKSSKYIMGTHYEEKHKELLPEDMTGYRYFYFLLTKKERGACVICKNPTDFNDIVDFAIIRNVKKRIKKKEMKG